MKKQDDTDSIHEESGVDNVHVAINDGPAETDNVAFPEEIDMR